jgi:hypothetical protein
MKEKFTVTFIRLPHRPYSIAKKLLNAENVQKTLLTLGKDEEFLFLLKEASPGFYKELRTHLDKGEVPQKLFSALYSYLMRLSFRSTPLGLTASVNLVDTTGEARLSSELDRKEVLILSPVEDQIPEDLLVLNDNCLMKESFLLFSRSLEGKVPVELKYRVSEQDIQLLQRFTGGASRTDVLRTYAGQGPEALLNARKMIHYWTEEKVLLNVTGDFFQELLKTEQSFKGLSLEDYRKQFDVNEVQIDTYDKLLTRKNELSIGSHYMSQITRAVVAIDRCFADHQSQSLHRRALRKYTQSFIERFGEKIVPLNEALNPRIGVAFGEVADTVDNEDITKYLKAKMSSFVIDRNKAWNITTKEIEEIAALNANQKTVRPEGLTAYGSLLEKNGEKFFYLKNTISGLSTMGISRFNSMGLCSDKVMQEMLAEDTPEDPGAGSNLMLMKFRLIPMISFLPGKMS